jgi:hypothetical protein
MSTSPPPPDGPNLSPKGKWGVAPSTSPQLTRRSGVFKSRGPLVWFLLVVAIVIAVVLIVLFVT